MLSVVEWFYSTVCMSRMTLIVVIVAVAAAFKAGKIQNNPFSQASTIGGAAIPPPSNLAGRIIYFF